MAVATAVHCHHSHAMILDCILVDKNPRGSLKLSSGRYDNAAFRFKNTDPNEKAIEINVNG